jgi:hypothetical protein
MPTPGHIADRDLRQMLKGIAQQLNRPDITPAVALKLLAEQKRIERAIREGAAERLQHKLDRAEAKERKEQENSESVH